MLQESLREVTLAREMTAAGLVKNGVRMQMDWR
jgi:hypothetical protein